jgi:hypothetical protein
VSAGNSDRSSGSSSEGGAVAVQNCKIFICRGDGCTFDHIIFIFSGGAADPWTCGLYTRYTKMHVQCDWHSDDPGGVKRRGYDYNCPAFCVTVHEKKRNCESEYYEASL